MCGGAGGEHVPLPVDQWREPDLSLVAWPPELKVFRPLDVRGRARVPGRRPLGMMCQDADVTLVA